MLDMQGKEIEIWSFHTPAPRRIDGFDFADLIYYMSGQIFAVFNVKSPMNIRYSMKWNKTTRKHEKIARYEISAHYLINGRKKSLCGTDMDIENVSYQKVNDDGSMKIPSSPKTVSKNGEQFKLYFRECGNCQYILEALNNQFLGIKEAIDKVRCTECGELACILCSYQEKKPFTGKLTCHHCHESFMTLKALGKLGSKR